MEIIPVLFGLVALLIIISLAVHKRQRKSWDGIITSTTDPAPPTPQPKKI